MDNGTVCRRVTAGAALWGLQWRSLPPDRLGAELGGQWWRCAVVTLAAAPYGATIGWWTSGRLALYAAIKLPLVLLATAMLTLGVCWVMARLLGWRVGLDLAATLVLLPLAVASVILLSLAPVSALFTLSAPAPESAARLTHNLLYLTHTGLVGVAALAGTTALWRLLRLLLADRRRADLIFILWLAAYAVVGGEVAWALRPFVGSVYEEVRFLRPNALEGNVYEFVLEDIVPYLATGAKPDGGNS